jgi:hypothetical protein
MSEELSNLDKVKISLAKIESRSNKIIFVLPNINIPAASVYEIYFQATTLKERGYHIMMLTETKDYVKPEFIESELMDLEHISSEEIKLTVSPEDIIVIPEIFTNVMELTKNLPCIRIVLLQSIDNATKALLPGYDWKTFGIENVLTTSKTMTKFVEEFYGRGSFDVKSYNVGVPDYFVDKYPLKKPVVSIMVRNEADLDKIVKLFLSKYPQYRWLNFEPLLTESKPPKHLRRKDFADRLGRNFAALWIDRISTHALFPLECMKVGTIPISFIPDVTPEYIINEGKIAENCGVWTDNFYNLPELIAETLRQFLDDDIGEKEFSGMKKIADQYSVAVSKQQIIEAYDQFLNKRADVFRKAIETVEKVKSDVISDAVVVEDTKEII